MQRVFRGDDLHNLTKLITMMHVTVAGMTCDTSNEPTGTENAARKHTYYSKQGIQVQLGPLPVLLLFRMFDVLFASANTLFETRSNEYRRADDCRFVQIECS